jgi:hypothetical protein
MKTEDPPQSSLGVGILVLHSRSLTGKSSMGCWWPARPRVKGRKSSKVLRGGRIGRRRIGAAANPTRLSMECLLNMLWPEASKLAVGRPAEIVLRSNGPTDETTGQQ